MDLTSIVFHVFYGLFSVYLLVLIVRYRREIKEKDQFLYALARHDFNGALRFLKVWFAEKFDCRLAFEGIEKDCFESLNVEQKVKVTNVLIKLCNRKPTSQEIRVKFSDGELSVDEIPNA